MLMMKMNDSMGTWTPKEKTLKESQILKLKTHEPNALDSPQLRA